MDSESESSLSSLDEEATDVESTTESTSESTTQSTTQSDSLVSELDSSDSDNEVVDERETGCDDSFGIGEPTRVTELAGVAGIFVRSRCFPTELGVPSSTVVVILDRLGLRAAEANSSVGRPLFMKIARIR